MSNKYREITDEFRLLYESFRESGFTEGQATELTKAYCTNAVFENVVRSVEMRKPRTPDLYELRRRLDKRRDTVPDTTGVGDCQLCGKLTPFLIGINKQIAGEFKQINVCPECRDKHWKELALTRKNFQDQFGG